MAIPVETTIKCKYCYSNLKGYYLWLENQMYFRCICECSHWLVKSTQLQQIFNIEM